MYVLLYGLLYLITACTQNVAVFGLSEKKTIYRLFILR